MPCFIFWPNLFVAGFRVDWWAAPSRGAKWRMHGLGQPAEWKHIRPPSANKWIILAVSTIQLYTIRLEGPLRALISASVCVYLPSPLSVVTVLPHTTLGCAHQPKPLPVHPCIYQDANLHPGSNWAFHFYIITCIRLIAIDGGLQRGTRGPTWLTLTFQLAEGKADGPNWTVKLSQY